MSNFKKLVQESKTRFYQSFANETRRIQTGEGIISISFDDVPISALNNGVPILDSHGVKATFYVAMGLAQTSSMNPPGTDNETYFSAADVQALDRAGHDIGCHTFSHYRLDQGSAEEMRDDATRNVQTLESIITGKRIEHFSYPFGQVSFKAKRLLGEHYKTMRSSRPGINMGRSDLYLLRASSIYAPSFDFEAIKRLVKHTVIHGGWLIFYTHGVDDKPDTYSCTPEQLNRVIDLSCTSGARILPVSDAFDAINRR